MKLLRSFPPLAFALVLLSIAGLCAAQHSIQWFLVAGTLAAISWYITEGPRGRTLPRWVSNVLVIGASLYVFIDLFQNRDDVMGVLGRFTIWLTLIKLYERRTARDHAHLLTLSLLMMMTGCLQSNDLLFGVILAIYAMLGLYVLLLHQLHAAFERARNTRVPFMPRDSRLVPPLKPIIGRHPVLHFRIQAMSVLIAGVALSILVFLGFPRQVGYDMLGTLRVASSTRLPQFTWNIDLNMGGRITESRARALTVQVIDNHGRVIHPHEPLLLRGAVLDRYEGQGQWKARDTRSNLIESSSSGFTKFNHDQVESRNIRTLRVVVHRAVDGVVPVFSTYAPIAVQTGEDAELLYDPIKQTIRTNSRGSRLGSYAVQAKTDDDDVALEDADDSPQRPQRRPWFGEEDQSRLRELAQSILRVARVDSAKGTWRWNRDAAAAFTDYLQSKGGFTYTTDLSSVAYSDLNDDPIVRFLLDSKRGHCEFFASGLAALCQSVGIPARLVVGYIAYEYDDEADQYNVLESNAHAWVEVAIGERRWLSFDPTPPATLIAIHGNESTLSDRLRWTYESFESDWSANVVGFDDAVQTQLAESFNRNWSRRMATALEGVRQWMERVNQAFYFGPAGYIWMAIVALALVIAIIALIKLMRRSLAIRRTLQLQHLRGGEYQRMLRQLGFYLDMLAVLKRGGLPKPMWQPPLDFARDAIVPQAPVGDLVRRITGLFYAARYGHQRLDRDQLENARSLVRELASELKVKW